MRYREVKPVVSLLRAMRKLELMSQPSFIVFYNKYIKMMTSREVAWWRRGDK